MKQDLKVMGAVAITSFIIVYICTVVLDKSYSYKIDSNKSITSSNKVNQTKKEEKNKESRSVVEEKNKELDIQEETKEQIIDNSKEIVESKPIAEDKIKEVNEEDISLGQRIIEFAIQYVGYPYVSGGNSLTNGTDCSGFVKLVYENFGISLPRTPYEQSYSGYQVSLENRMPGDIITYGYNGSVTHSALYIGEDKVVHAATPSQGIIYGNIYMMPIISIRRVL